MCPPEGAVTQVRSLTTCTFTFVTIGGDNPETELVLQNCTFMFVATVVATLFESSGLGKGALSLPLHVYLGAVWKT